MSASVVLYGLKNCDTCRKALKMLGDKGIDVRLHDLRKDGLDAEMLDRWLSALGWEVLLNKRGTTWRGLDDSLKDNLDDAGVRALLLEHPALIKRPVSEASGAGDTVIRVGFGKAEQAALMGEA
ncbi:arsenate reductase [Kiloniella sp. b19]|uniref:arsenate reductase n=1 Tax=Kiloniella sp. GXU_MW_B19 TaxID=3141326 RepID=UPI0031D996E8